MIERKESEVICNCGKKMTEIRKDGQLFAISCTCGIRMSTEEEYKRMRQNQLLCADGIVGEQARKEAQQMRKEAFEYGFIPGQSRTKWVPAGYNRRKKRRVKLKKLALLLLITFVVSGLFLVVLDLFFATRIL